jgi:hypothetical protein
MNATVSEIIGIFAALVVVAGLSFAIANGGNTAKIIGSVGTAFQGSIRAATLR